jgi:hypothetical protein
MSKSTINFSDPVAKARFCNQARQLEDEWDVEFKRHYAGRTNKQNRTYWGMVVTAFADYLTEQWGYEHTTDDAHIELRKAILGKEITNPHTGEVKMVYPSTTKLSTAQFSEFFERARAMVEELTGVPIPDPDPRYREKRQVPA